MRGRGRFPRWNPLGRYVRYKLQRRLFWWFGLNIIVTGLVVIIVMHTVSQGSNAEWSKMFEGGQQFLASQFAAAWNDPQRRDALASELSRDVGVIVSLKDTKGALVSSTGRCDGSTHDLPVLQSGTPVGTLQICMPRRGPQNAWRVALPVGLALMMLWAASGRLARRLSHPLNELARVAEEIGTGNLAARVELSRREDSEIAAIALAVNEMAGRIEKQMRDQRELLAAVSHELRTPLQRIRLITELGRGGTLTEKTLDSLDQEVIELDALVGDLLASSRLDFGQLTLKALDSKDIAVRALERATLPPELLDVRGASVVFDADATLVGRALANLLENARRHGGGAKVLRVSTSGDRVVFEVDDAGPGFQGDEAAKAFDPFFRRPKTTEAEAASLGLGLSLVKRVAEAHGGKAWAGNRPDGPGARVGFEIPLRKA
ncbi:MAG: ATP-binding protein [Myxococcaceae bacterium]